MGKITRLLSFGLAGQIALVVFVTTALSFFGSELLYKRAEADLVASSQAERIAGRLVLADRLIGALPPERRSAAATELSTDSLRLRWPAEATTIGATRPHGIGARLTQLEPRLAGHDIHLAEQPGGGVGGTIRLADGSRLGFRTEGRTARVPTLGNHLVSLLMLTGGVLLATLLLLRALAEPLRALARATARAGLGEPITVPEEGPEEVISLARAVNAMQARLIALVDDRTQALAAVSHDLLTPIARLRLRAGALEPGETRDAILRDVDEMQAFMTSVLGYLRGAEPEAARPIDLASTIMTIVDDAADTGADAEYDGPDRLSATLPPLRIRSAVANLVENALRHAGQARVSLARTDDAIRITVDDDGPGIAEGEMESVFEPFRRLDASRSRESGGAGLGLAIVKRALEGIGRVTLANRPKGGLRATIVIPVVK
ncbi:Signal transduction histidine kinase [Sphingomonas laterariae]|uniref:histidine kinase n=1 Tax=Edaphosphingomonas laterariae TaxID=861865 RepID=A0A239GVZ6_9SPHN|nr:ATP-binding protein [Sphingomonas laterariae]SNS73287.1 Signal transduction histidine kinase [Sphingomonas laterariae]